MEFKNRNGHFKGNIMRKKRAPVIKSNITLVSITILVLCKMIKYQIIKTQLNKIKM